MLFFELRKISKGKKEAILERKDLKPKARNTERAMDRFLCNFPIYLHLPSCEKLPHLQLKDPSTTCLCTVVCDVQITCMLKMYHPLYLTSKYGKVMTSL